MQPLTLQVAPVPQVVWIQVVLVPQVAPVPQVNYILQVQVQVVQVAQAHN